MPTVCKYPEDSNPLEYLYFIGYLVPKASTEYKTYSIVIIDYFYIYCAIMTGILTGTPHETA